MIWIVPAVAYLLCGVVAFFATYPGGWSELKRDSRFYRLNVALVALAYLVAWWLVLPKLKMLPGHDKPPPRHLRGLP